jgi:hypothetical protein
MRMPQETASKKPAVARLAGELSLNVDLMPMPRAMPPGVVNEKKAAIMRYGGLRHVKTSSGLEV